MKRYRLHVICLFAAFALLWNGPFLPSASAMASSNELIIVNKKTNQLAFFKDGELIKTFSVATGKTSDLTPEGSFKIVNKIKNRPYYKEHIPGGDPRNPLGDRWLGLEVNGTEGTTYAIHGNNNVKSIGKYVSAGCIRMKNDEIHWLFPQIELGTSVIITTSKLSFEDIAAQHGYSVSRQYAGKLLLNGRTVALAQPLLLADAHVFIPMREVFELLGAQVTWDDASKTAAAVIGKRTMIVKPFEGIVEVNGSVQTMTAAKLIGPTVMLPLRSLSEVSGFGVEWDGQAKEIRLGSPEGV